MQIRLILSGLALLICLLLGYGTYSYVRNLGYQEANKECIDKFNKYQSEIDTKIGEIQTGISGISGTLVAQNENLSQDISIILARTKNKPTVVVKEGKCIPSDTFVKDINDAIERANKR